MGSGPADYSAGRARECFEVADSGRNASCDAGPGTDKTKDHKPGLKVPQLGRCDGAKWSFEAKSRLRGPHLGHSIEPNAGLNGE